MGATQAIPGASAGTFAFITGIYEELIHSLRSIDRASMQLLLEKDLAGWWKKINGNFLAVTFAGVLTGLFTLGQLIAYFMKSQPILVLSFFFGLILISGPLVLRSIKKWDFTAVISFVAGLAVAYALTLVSPVHTPDALWFIIIVGALTFSAMLLPGISGAFMLIVVGKHPLIQSAVATANVPVILLFITGGVLSFIGFTRFLSWVLDRYHSATVALLTGLMLGFLNKVWPWRHTIEFVTNHKGEQVAAFDKSILPWDYLAATGKDPQVFQAILLMAIGVFIVVLIEKIAARLKTKI